jgi:putative membrane protein
MMLARVLVNWLVLAFAVWVATAVVPGIDVPGGAVTYLGVSLLFGLVNAVLGPVLHLVTLPLSVLTLGLIALVVNGLLLSVTAALSSNLDVRGIGSAVLGALVISVVTTLLELVLRPLERQPASIIRHG